MTVSPLTILTVVAYLVLEWLAASALASLIGWGGVLLTFAGLVIVGAAVMRRAGFAAAQSLRPVTVDGVTVAQGMTQQRAGEVGREVGDAGSLFVAGLLIAVPGLVTSAVGLVLLVAPVRRVAAGAASRSLRRRAQAAGIVVTGAAATTVAGSVVRDEPPRAVRGEIIAGEVVDPSTPNTGDQPPPAAR